MYFSKRKNEVRSDIITILGFKFSYTRTHKHKKAKTSRYHEGFARCGYSLTERDAGYLIESNTLKVFGTAENTLWTCTDVLCKEDYSVSIQEDHIMFDIGANIGTTSLYSSQNKYITHIYGFEPFKQTYDQAQYNLQLNPNLADKITFFQYGLGETNKTLDIHYNANRPGSMSTVQDRFADKDTPVEHVDIRNATEALAPLIEKHTKKVFAKIDCEGAELEILTDLNKSRLLKKIDIIIMEWHFNYPSALIEILTENNFTVFTTHSKINELGMIRAVRQA